MKNAVIVEGINFFNIKQILESGQIFRFQKINDTTYIIVAKDKVIKVGHQPNSTSILICNSTVGDLEQIWKPYFDLETNYEEIIDTLNNKDEHMQTAIRFGEGIRILRQDPWEMLISFIISQNNSIPQIKNCIENITRKFGEKLENIDSEIEFYSFPSPEDLVKVSEEELRECKVGFRAPYIMDACKKIIEEEINLNEIFTMKTELARDTLMKIKGVGPKIADCILLFSYGKMEVFPTDVWIKRVIEGLYFEGKEQKLRDIQQFAKEYYGELAGYAQQYLFYYAREHELFKK
ncbi:8-oxoguanine DNA glycosylase [Candidatus Epulonipiscium fishelsonii]|uniref:8-oxoguanine DNA glycosylase n=1 Tax=Candidatus Epulonipiscium fishelsonii TaxID=77094 RepID=A0ACC8XA92_9FIRM|nr:8-oxoguanine DNA glycosylase [Epulopiscium sp. SCG-D08WGA-EpuloA1]OON96840.1 MAG: 8-oxoguanine DNA glycosylase [Epulopiscium sp. AS2M-Bin002]